MYKVCREYLPDEVIDIIGSYNGRGSEELRNCKDRIMRVISGAAVDAEHITYTVMDICRSYRHLFIFINGEGTAILRFNWIHYIDLLLDYGSHVMQLTLNFVAEDEDDHEAEDLTDYFDTLSLYMIDLGFNRELLRVITMQLSDDVVNTLDD